VSATPLVIGVLALQGAYDAHVQALTALGAIPRLVRVPQELEGLAGLIMPGGESTTMLKFLERNGFFDILQTYVKSTPTFGTCAGAILLANHVIGPTQRSLAALDITVERNAYGRQIDSTGPSVETLATRDGFPTLVRSGHLLAATFHPELSSDPRVHQLFLSLVREHQTATH